MSLFKAIRVFVFDRKELAFQILGRAFYKEIARWEKQDVERQYLYE